MTTALFFTAFSLGLRHGVDWDHIAAVADLTGAAESKRRGVFLSFLYAMGHAAVVFVLGVVAIVFGASLPGGIDHWMARVVGVTLVALGCWVVVELVRHGREFRLRSRWLLVMDGTAAGVRRAQSRAGREGVALPASPAAQYGRGTATGIGMLHGVGVESPTQIALFVASTSVAGQGAGLALLLVWVSGLVMANMGLAGLAALGLLHAERNFTLYACFALFVAVGSIAMGALLLLGFDALPEIAL